MNNLISEVSTMNLGEILLFGFWGTCVVMFYSVITYSIFMGVKDFIKRTFKNKNYESIR